ncbi:MAG: O-antigen ligase family protein [Candidatus Coproplasma sp.]
MKVQQVLKERNKCNNNNVLDRITLRDFSFCGIQFYCCIAMLFWLPSVIDGCSTFITSINNYIGYLGLLFCFLYLFSCICENRIIKFDWSCVFALLFAIYSAIITIYRGSRIQMWKMFDILLWPLFYCIAFDYGYQRKKQSGKTSKFFSIFFLVLFCCLSIPNISLHLSGAGNDGGVIFPLYVLIFFIPYYFTLYGKNNIILFVSLIFIVLTTKRAGLVAMFGAVIAYYFCNAIMVNKLKNRAGKLLKFIVAMFFLFLGFLIIVNVFDLDIIERFLNISDDGGSGRDLIWELVIDDFNQSSLNEKIFGHGYHTVMQVTGSSIIDREVLAHNDYLEILYDYGIIGLVLCASWLVSILIKYFVSLKKKEKNVPILSYIVVCLLVLTIFSYVMVQSKIIIFVVIALGLQFGESKRKTNGETK